MEEEEDLTGEEFGKSPRLVYCSTFEGASNGIPYTTCTALKVTPPGLEVTMCFVVPLDSSSGPDFQG